MKYPNRYPFLLATWLTFAVLLSASCTATSSEPDVPSDTGSQDSVSLNDTAPSETDSPTQDTSGPGDIPDTSGPEDVGVDTNTQDVSDDTNVQDTSAIVDTSSADIADAAVEVDVDAASDTGPDTETDGGCEGAQCEAKPCGSPTDLPCAAGYYCDTLKTPSLCAPQEDAFWTAHQWPEEVVDGKRVVFYVSSSLGDDATGDGSQNKPFKTLNRANLALRTAAGAYTGPYGPGEHEGRGEIGKILGGVPALHSAILLRRGDTFNVEDEKAYLEGAGLGGLPSTLSGSAMLAIEVGGVSADERFILSGYGPGGPDDYSGPRPILHMSRNEVHTSGPLIGKQKTCQAITMEVTGYGNGQSAGVFCPSGVLEACLDDIARLKHVTIAGIEIAPSAPQGELFPTYHRDHKTASLLGIVLREGVAEDWLFEDLYMHHIFGGIFTSGVYGLDTYAFGDKSTDVRIRHKNLRIRRCIFAETYAGTAGQSTASAIAGRHADHVLIDECIFDQVSWSPDLDPITATDPELFPGKINFHPLGPDESPVYDSVKFGNNWGAFSVDASPHTIYIRHESGDDFSARGSLVLRPAANRDKWNTGVKLVNAVYVDGGIVLGAGDDQIADASFGQGVRHATIRDNVFTGLSRHFNDYGISLFGNTNGAHVAGNVFRIRGESRRPTLTIENRTNETVSVSFNTTTKQFKLGDATLNLVKEPPTCSVTGLSATCTGWTTGDLCNFIHQIRAEGEAPGTRFRCALRESTLGQALYETDPVTAEIKPGKERFILYSGPGRGDFHHGTVMAAMKWVTLVLPTDPIAMFTEAGWTDPLPKVPTGSVTGIRITQPSTGAEGWLRTAASIAPVQGDGGTTTYRILVGQTGELVSSPLFDPSPETGDALIFTKTPTPTPGPNAPTYTYEGNYSIEFPKPLVIEHNAFDVFGANTTPETPTMTAPSGHHIRLAGSAAPITIRANTIYSPIKFWGVDAGPGAITQFHRPDLILASPGHQLHNRSATNSFAGSPTSLKSLWWSESNPLSWTDLVPTPIQFVDNDIRYLPTGDIDWLFGFNISEFATWVQFNTGMFYDYDEFCEILAEGSDCGLTGETKNRLHVDDASWVEAGLPDPNDYFNATFKAYRENLGLTLPPSRYQNPLSRDRELNFASDVVRAKRRGDWNNAYDVYGLLNFMRARYGLSKITSPYSN